MRTKSLKLIAIIGFGAVYFVGCKARPEEATNVPKPAIALSTDTTSVHLHELDKSSAAINLDRDPVGGEVEQSRRDPSRGNSSRNIVELFF
jgi:hypothetical protein